MLIGPPMASTSTENFIVLPPGPPNVPPDLARPTLGYRFRVVLALFGLLLFLLFYLALMAGSAFLLVWALFPPADLAQQLPDTTGAAVFFLLVRAGVFLVSALIFIFLFKGFLARGKTGLEHCVAVSETEQPDLIRCVRDLCREIGSPVPTGIYLNHEVNAGIYTSTSILNLFVRPPQNLLLGLGLMGDLNLVEFKALLAHEFGHSSQRALRLSGYLTLVHRVLFNMVHVRDRWDSLIVRWFDVPLLSIVATPLDLLLGGTRRLLAGLFRILDAAQRSLRWEMEYNADLVAVSAAGSDAAVHLLMKSELGNIHQRQAIMDLALAADHDLFTRDLFVHQARAALAAEKSSPLPVGPDLFVPEETGQPLAMWVDHPPHFMRERNAKRRYFPSPRDDRPALVLLREGARVREEVTRKFYESTLQREPPDTLADPEAVEAFLKEEQAALQPDLRWHGIYHKRYLDPGFLVERPRTDGPSTPADLEARLARLQTEAANLVPLMASEEEDHRRLAAFDHDVFSLHNTLALDLGRLEEFFQWYQFHVALQPLHALAWQQKDRVEQVANFLRAHPMVRHEEVGELWGILTEVAEGVAQIYRIASDLRLPLLKHLPAGELLVKVLPPGPMLPDLTSPDAILAQGTLPFMENQVMGLLDRLNRALLKSLNGLLGIQDELVAQWKARAGEGKPPLDQPPAAEKPVC